MVDKYVDGGKGTTARNWLLGQIQNSAFNVIIADNPKWAIIPYDIVYTCSDNIQNGGETGVDCGGSCPNSCSAPGVGVRPWAISGRSIAPGGRPIAQPGG